MVARLWRCVWAEMLQVYLCKQHLDNSVFKVSAPAAYERTAAQKTNLAVRVIQENTRSIFTEIYETCKNEQNTVCGQNAYSFNL